MSDKQENREKGPKTFVPKFYKRTLEKIRQNQQSFSPEAELELAKICGGATLMDAVDIEARAPCEGNPPNCDTCWVGPYCCHKGKPLELRLAEAAEQKAESKKHKDKVEKTTSSLNLKDDDLGDLV